MKLFHVPKGLPFSRLLELRILNCGLGYLCRWARCCYKRKTLNTRGTICYITNGKDTYGKMQERNLSVTLDTRHALLRFFTALPAHLGTSHATDNGLADLVSWDPGGLMVNGSRVGPRRPGATTALTLSLAQPSSTTSACQCLRCGWSVPALQLVLSDY